MNRQGSVILHVLVTGILVALIAALLLRVSFNSYLVTARTNAETVQLRQDSGALAVVIAGWNANNRVCSGGGGTSGYTCPGATPGTCACTCTVTGFPTATTSVNVTAAMFDSVCQVQMVPNQDTVTQTLSDSGATGY